MISPLESIQLRFAAQRLIPVFYHSDRVLCTAVIETCYQAGVTVFEFTNRGPEALANFQYLKLATQHLSNLCLGIGTILTVQAAQPFLQAGADFVVSPALVPEMAAIQTHQQRLWIPGCGTVSEVVQARALGASLVKLYPADSLTPRFLSSVKAVLPDAALMPTGGIAAEPGELMRWFNAGATCIGLGSQLFTSDVIQPNQNSQLHTKIEYLLGQVNPNR